LIAPFVFWENRRKGKGHIALLSLILFFLAWARFFETAITCFFYAISFNIFLIKQKYILFAKQKLFDGKRKMRKKFEFKKLKIANTDICSFWDIFNF